MGMGNGVAGMVIIMVMTGIIPENSLRLAPVSFWRLTPGLYNQPANGMAVCSVGYNYPIRDSSPETANETPKACISRRWANLPCSTGKSQLLRLGGTWWSHVNKQWSNGHLWCFRFLMFFCFCCPKNYIYIYINVIIIISIIIDVIFIVIVIIIILIHYIYLYYM